MYQRELRALVANSAFNTAELAVALRAEGLDRV